MENILEIWKAIPNYEGIYEASNTGKVRSLDRTVFRKKGVHGKKKQSEHYAKFKGKFLSQSIVSGGYLSVHIGTLVDNKKILVHVVIGKTFLDKDYVEKGLTVNHKDGNKKNNYLSNLEIITQAENNKHAKETGLNNNSGENHKFAKLTWEKVRYIRESSLSHSVLGKELNVSPSNIGHVKNYKTWKE